MAYLLHFLLLILASLHLYATTETPEAYVIYLGGTGSEEAANSTDIEAVNLKIEEKERINLIQSYSHALKGFSALLTKKEADLLSRHDKVVSVFRDQILHPHTTRSWDFLEAESGLGSERAHRRASNDVIIGIIDTGIWPESPSFDDSGMAPIPSRWKGICMEGFDFKRSNCNRKLIGARYYTGQPDSIHPSLSFAGSPRDTVGHGTHTASTAAGSTVQNASYYGLAKGVAKGGATTSRIAMYKACSIGGCSSSAVLKAIDDAIGDGVDIISISLGMSSVFQSDFLSDTIAIGAFHANQKGVLVVCSGGNDGPDSFTVVNTAPWVLTVGASSIDRIFQSTIVLGNSLVLQGVAINFSNHTGSQSYPLILGGDAAAQFTPVSEASNCYPGSLDTKKAARKIIICMDNDPSVTRRVKKLVAEYAGAKGLILIDEDEKGIPFDSGSFAFSEVGNKAGAQILEYMKSTKYPSAIILPTINLDKTTPAPVVAYFSSRGPGGLTESILKPDLIAPGVSILAAAMPVASSDTTPAGNKPSSFAIKSGTSMACPHVAGAAAFVRSAHPRWSPSMIRSALMTTATITNNLGKKLTTSSGANATYHDTGAGEISPLRALSPGLVFETTTEDYLYFLCYYGYKDGVIRSITGNNRFSCPPDPSSDLISELNYPSISVGKIDRGYGGVRTVHRTVVNVGPANSTYVAEVEVASGLEVKVSPEKLVFARRGTRATYQITFDGRRAEKGYRFGSLTWSDGAHSVRTVFAVNIV
ncbi:Subtilisin-like protease [Apostasia shenzhenica]|uniref:Subtilisin-like protease n=1 Tax=Apostasia shenzhenica TaxID=1088818 RepID=A0A2I0B236_9ASPA|nr:Subtilisin-like protease [Apostasia shenzhenica]